MEGVVSIARAAAGDFAGAAEALRRDGIVAVEDLWSADAIDGLRDVVTEQHPEFADQARLDDYLGDKNERFIAPVALTAAVRQTGVLECAALEGVCAALLGDAFVYEAFGMLWVDPGAPPQRSHRDGGLLFPESGVDRILPPSAITVAIPLVDVDAEWAPTGVAPGSHRLEPGSSARELVPLELERGSVAIWDFRVLHAGLANKTDRARPALYFTVCRPFWVDHMNFRKNARAKLVGDAEVIAQLGPRFIRARPAGAVAAG